MRVTLIYVSLREYTALHPRDKKQEASVREVEADWNAFRADAARRVRKPRASRAIGVHAWIPLIEERDYGFLVVEGSVRRVVKSIVWRAIRSAFIAVRVRVAQFRRNFAAVDYNSLPSAPPPSPGDDNPRHKSHYAARETGRGRGEGEGEPYAAVQPP